MASIRITTPVGVETTVVASTLADAVNLLTAGAITAVQFAELELGLVAEGVDLFPAAHIEGLVAGDPLLRASGLGAPDLLPVGNEPGADLRDIEQRPTLVGGGIVVRSASALATRMGVNLPTATGIFALVPAGTRASLGSIWAMMPSWIKTALGFLGITVAADIVIDRLLGSPDMPGGFGVNGDHGVHLPHDISAHIVGSWVANEVTFYRLSDGRIAVQNKKGRWKVWRPKKPIVLMPTGAVDLRTLLRADAVLNKQAKRLAAMLNRRAPRQRRSKVPTVSDSVIVIDGKAVTK